MRTSHKQKTSALLESSAAFWKPFLNKETGFGQELENGGREISLHSLNLVSACSSSAACPGLAEVGSVLCATLPPGLRGAGALLQLAAPAAWSRARLHHNSYCVSLINALLKL